MNTFIRIAGLQAEILTCDLQNTKQSANHSVMTLGDTNVLHATSQTTKGITNVAM
jgi:hypothetical protein